MKPLTAALVLAALAASSFVVVVSKSTEAPGTPLPQDIRYLAGLRAEARFNESWDHDEVKDALERAGFQIVNDTEWTLRGQRAGEPVAVVLPLGEHVVFHVLYPLDEPIAFEGDEDDVPPQWDDMKATFETMLADFERASGWEHHDVTVRPLVTEG